MNTDLYEDEEPIGVIEDGIRLVPTRMISRGGMGIVYEASMLGREGFAKRVAVKMLRKKWSDNRRFINLLVAEAKLVSNLVHENIVQMYLLGRLPDGRDYMVMEYVEGISLFELMLRHWEKRTRIPPPLGIHICSRVARGLGYAHAVRDESGAHIDIVHRDICPSNILITTEGLPKLIDFGVAKARTMSIIGDDWQLGKAGYMSPEQAKRKTVDHTSDIFALGAVLFEVLCGRAMRDLSERGRNAKFAENPVPWHYLDGIVDSELKAILGGCLASDPAARYRDANDVAVALEEYIYRDGYGPTIQTVEAHLRKEFPELYTYPRRPVALPQADRQTRNWDSREYDA